MKYCFKPLNCCSKNLLFTGGRFTLTICLVELRCFNIQWSPCGPFEKDCKTDSILILKSSAKQAHRALLAKLQFRQLKVTHLQHILENGQTKTAVCTASSTHKDAFFLKHDQLFPAFDPKLLCNALRTATLDSAPDSVQLHSQTSRLLLHLYRPWACQTVFFRHLGSKTWLSLLHCGILFF